MAASSRIKGYWERVGYLGRPYRILPGVYILGGPEITDPDDCCVYLVEAKGEVAVIDAGLGLSAGVLLRNLLSFGLHPEQVKYLIATHGHADHAGGLAELQSSTGAPVVAHRLELPFLEGGDLTLTAALLYGVGFQPVQVAKVMEEDSLELPLGDKKLYLLHTPGHTPGSISLYLEAEGQRVLFAQDVHGPFRPEWGSDRAAWRRSVELLKSLEADVLCEGHFGVFRPADRVERYLYRCLLSHRD